MTNDGTPDLAGLCSGLADELDEVTSKTDGDITSYQRGGTVFAHVSHASLDTRLPEDIGTAALRTRDTTRAGERGWIRFTPGDDERHVIDRATAWFQTAWRYAEGR